MIGRLLIANRGEIAVRVVRACRELGIGTVAVHEPADAGAAHVELADVALPVESYLDAGAIVAAARDAGADALHPGYGYLAESPELAERCRAAGITWVGPPAQTMRLVGDKVEARRLAQAAGLPVAPGYAGVDLSDAALAREAARLGFPLLVKAAAGGGGRGMRVVANAPGLADAVAAARREARAAFGDDRVFLEREVPAARHVEVQLLADGHGRAMHLGERDCSVQRRHQKVLEESPSPVVDARLREELGAAAVRLAEAAGYVNAGTAEFLLDADGRWVFLELNARLQVEHPVTEAVTGLDLVRAQLQIAGGEPLELDQEDVAPRGHALECRLYAEDPARDFLPSTGRIERFFVPSWPGVRVDAGVRPGDEVGTRYDPLLAKIVCQAEDRDACLERAAAVLRETVVLGVVTNLGFLRAVVDDPEFRRGAATTGFVARRWSAGQVPVLGDELRRAARALAAPAASAWHAFAGPAGETPRDLHVHGRHVLYRGFAYALDEDEGAAAQAEDGGGSLAAPMPGTVLRVDVAPGDAVARGQTLLLLEAMKMELAVSAPHDGTVVAVHARAGELVRAGQTLVEVEP